MPEDWHNYFSRIFAALKERFAESFPFALRDESELPPTVISLCQLSSDCLAWKKTELEHKRLMREVFKRLLWREKIAGWIESNELMVIASTNIEGKEWDSFRVTPHKWQECPIPEKLEHPRRRLLRMKPPTSYLGTRIRPR